jgi:RNA polymerase sigma-70 factor (ECF subfamily)
MNGDYSSEKKLVEKAIRGEKTAQTKIVSDNERLVYNTALKLLANETEAECVLQETFLKVFQALPTFKGQSSLSTWIYRIATNYALMRLRARKKEAADLDESQSDISQDTIDTFNRALGNNPLNTVINNELRESMQQAIEELPPKFRSVFILKDIEGYSLKEIAEMLDMTLAAVKSNLHRARLFLRDRLANYVGSEPLIQP